MKTKLFFRGMVIFLMLGCMSAFAQTFNGSNGNVITSDNPCTDGTVNAVGVPEGSVIDNVTINITHTWDADLDISIISPGGTEIELTSDNGGSGDNYTDTVFRADATTSVIGGSELAPFTGDFLPEGDLGAADGQNFNGDWLLRVCDDTGGDTGILNSWSITFVEGPDCTAADVAGAIVEDCDNNQFYVNITVIKRNDGISLMSGLDSWEMPGDGESVQIGPFPSGSTATVSVVHDNSSDNSPQGSPCNFVLDEYTASCPPPNDTCPDAVDISCGDTVQGFTTGASDIGAPTGFCGTTPGDSGVWYTFIGTGGEVTATTDNPGTDYDTKLNVYSGSCEDLVCVGGDDDINFPSNPRSIVTFSSVLGETYYLYVNGFSDSTGNFELSVVCALTADIAEDCITVYDGYDDLACVDLTVETTYGVAPLSYLWSNGDTTDTINVCPTSTTEYSVTVTDAAGNTASDSTVVVVVNTNCDTEGNGDKVEVCHKGNTICVDANAVQAHLNHGDSLGACEGTFTCDTAPDCSVVTNPADGALLGPEDADADISWSQADGYVVGYTINVGTTPGGTDVADNLDVGNVLTYDLGQLSNNTTYYVNVSPYNNIDGASGCAESSFTTDFTPANDTCLTAQEISCETGSVDGDTTFATEISTQSPDCEDNTWSDINGTGVWYTIVGNGDIITLSTCGAASFDTKIDVYTGTCDGLTCLVGNDDTSGCSGLTSEVEFPSVDGETYYVFVTGFYSEFSGTTATGTFTLSVECTAPPEATIVDCSGSGESENVPNYGNNEFIEWLYSSSNGDVLTVAFNGSTESGWDFIWIYDGLDASAPLLDVISGSLAGQSFTSTGTDLYIEFLSDNIVSGFTFGFDVTCGAPPPPPEPCASVGPIDYGNNEFLEWTYSSNTSEPLTVIFNGSTENNFDFIYVYDGLDSSAPLLAAISGSLNGLSYTSFGTDLYIEFLSDSSVTSGPFGFDIIGDCGAPPPSANPVDNNTIAWGLSPNPSIGTVDLDLKNFLNSDVTIEVLDLTGKVFATHRLEDLQNPKYRIQLNASLTDGMYLVRLSSDQNVSAKRLILNR